MSEHARAALSRWQGLEGASLSAIPQGLINQSYAVEAAQGRFVLQRVAPVFDPAIHDNILAVTERLAAAGLATPRLVRTRAGELYATHEQAVWRLMTWIEGASFDRLSGHTQARAAGELVGRFHAALAGLPHRFVAMRAGVHDTARHLAALRDALLEESDHRLRGDVAELATEVLARAASLEPLPLLTDVIGHGDLKLSNVRFAGASGAEGERALCLIDLDTVGPIALAHELGDAWRSWCNASGEDDASAVFDLAAFEASWGGYAAGIGRALSDDERRALLGGPEWISLELAARFAADALRERYFGWDRARFAAAGEHNLLRARGQLALHRAIVATRAERARMLGAIA